MTRNQTSTIIIPAGVNIWSHEYATAEALANAGYKVEFIRKSNREREHSADCYVNGAKWELKSPRANHLKTIRKNIKNARQQSDQIIKIK